MNLPQNTVSVKFFSTDADPEEVTYLRGAPEFTAFIDPTPRTGDPAKRVPRTVRLLQMDIAIKDSRARETGWVFGTFGWVGPATGDHFFDNLEYVSLQWGDDPGVYDSNIRESWINESLRGTMFGWDERETLGFNGRANGPADNIRSSCISCHSSARVPRSTLGILGFRFNIDRDMNAFARVKSHVDTWFTNRSGAEVFRPGEPSASVLDYSLQLDAAIFRMCEACGDGHLKGETPLICRTAGFHNQPTCKKLSVEGRDKSILPEAFSLPASSQRLSMPPRQ